MPLLGHLLAFWRVLGKVYQCKQRIESYFLHTFLSHIRVSLVHNLMQVGKLNHFRNKIFGQELGLDNLIFPHQVLGQ